MPGIFHWICCLCCCPDGLPSAYQLDGHIEQGPPAPNATDCHTDFLISLDVDAPCVYQGVYDCGASLHPFTLGRVGPAQGYPSCGWVIGTHEGGSSFKAGDDPTGAYPDITIFNGFGEPTFYTALVIS